MLGHGGQQALVDSAYFAVKPSSKAQLRRWAGVTRLTRGNRVREECAQGERVYERVGPSGRVH